jgi:ketosteroid isomerase-like protein
MDAVKDRVVRRFGFAVALTCMGIAAARSWAQAPSATAQPARTSADDGAAADEIRQVVAKYAEAVNREPVDLELASQVWENSPEATLIYPLAEIHGWDQIRQGFYQGVMETWFSERTLTPRDLEVHAYGDCGWVEFSWRFVAKSRKDGSRVETNGRETQIYRKAGPHRWVLVHVHYSSLSPAENSRPSGTS